MDEQRILEEMERMLAADDPKLAARLAAFGQPGFGQVLRTRRARATISAIALVLIAAVAAVIFMMSSLRSGGAPNGRGQQSAQHTTPRPSSLSSSAAPRVSPCIAVPAPECGKQWIPPRTWPESAIRVSSR
jgi:Protein of unknown function (DUF3040)